ncbi:TPA: hypothetical protein EYG96_00600 [Candidatus Gracilibacteria bacterium]|nr:hypothetical protein [Candidatus Peregrinibacteria bacterium]HIQ56526.1 hypothetical protein [Candidatus Gracilibacteria bacterium]HIQ57301.1 hypothetical protein [Candidatus Gracilibacteria bacterium]
MENYTDEHLGNFTTKQRIINSIIQKNMPHALLISGPKNTGKYNFLHTLATKILNNKNPISPYLVTVDELYKEGVNSLEEISAQNNSSFNQFERKKQKKKSDKIGVEDIEAATKYLYETIDGDAKIVIIRDIERMTIPASNKFLKLLEEPPQKTFFFLTTSTPLKILATIISRCRTENFSLLSQKEMEETLNDSEKNTEFYSENEKKMLMLLSAGKSELFEKMQNNEEFFTEKKEKYKEVLELEKMTNLEKMQKAETFAKINITEILDFLELLLLVKRENLQNVKNRENSKTLEILEKTDEAIILLQQNANKRLVLENLFLSL